MSQLSLTNGRRIAIDSVAKYASEGPLNGKPFSVEAVNRHVENSQNVVDNAFLTDGLSITVVSKQNLGAAGLKAGDRVSLDGQEMEVLRVHDRPDTYLEKLSFGWTLLKLHAMDQLGRSGRMF